MNVYDQAHQLAKAIRESEEFKQLEKKKKQIEENPELDKAIKDFMGKQLELQTMQMMGQSVDESAFQQLQQLSVVLMQDPLAANYLQCQMRFTMMMSDVYKIVGEVSDFGLDGPFKNMG